MNDSAAVAAKISSRLSQLGFLSAPAELSSLDAMVLAPTIRKRLSRIVLEQSKQDALRARGLRPSRKLLFSGLPGTGKTMAAGAIALSLQVPMFRVELHDVFSKFFGESAQKLALVFDYVRLMPAVYLFDEFDSIGSERSAIGSDADGGEARRIVNSLLQFIENDRSSSLIIAATNHAQMLDSAMFRRFDEVIEFQPMTKDELVALAGRKLSGFDIADLDYDAIFDANQVLGHADFCAVIDRACKDQVLDGTVISTEILVDGIIDRTSVRDSAVGA